jgi:predicted kinase
MKKLIIMRGPPGSGKSTQAQALATYYGGEVFSTDDYFINDIGQYVFDAKALTKAHAWNQQRVSKALQSGAPCVIVDNTNVQAWEAKPYCVAGVLFGYAIELYEPVTPWSFDAPTLAQKNTHGVSQEAIERMLSRWEYNLTVADCLAAKAPWET